MKAKAKRLREFICDCPLGSPNAGHVILVPALHKRTCHVRKTLARMSFEKGDLLNG
jgi:hypothetical protein